MELWFTEKQTPSVGLTCKVLRTLTTRRTPFQHLAVLETEPFGRMLVLDGVVQTTVFDEFTYHEMLAHVPLFTHPHPRRVAVIGGGDGGTLREVLKHPTVEEATLIEIDREVIEASREFLPELSRGFDDPRVRIVVADGIEHMREQRDAYDVILIDSTDPVGPAAGLFTEAFYRDVYAALTEDGVAVAQTESPFYSPQLVQHAFGALSRVFPIARLYHATVPTYPGGLWTFALGSKRHDPLAVPPERWAERQVSGRYYSPALHGASFVLPRFLEELAEKARTVEAAEPAGERP